MAIDPLDEKMAYNAKYIDRSKHETGPQQSAGDLHRQNPHKQSREERACQPDVDQPPASPCPAFMRQFTHQGDDLSSHQGPVAVLPDEERHDFIEISHRTLS